MAYAIGERGPLSVNINTFGTGQIPDGQILQIVSRLFDLTPGAIIEKLQLRRPIYRQVAAFGHLLGARISTWPGRRTTWWTRCATLQASDPFRAGLSQPGGKHDIGAEDTGAHRALCPL